MSANEHHAMIDLVSDHEEKFFRGEIETSAPGNSISNEKKMNKKRKTEGEENESIGGSKKKTARLSEDVKSQRSNVDDEKLIDLAKKYGPSSVFTAKLLMASYPPGYFKTHNHKHLSKKQIRHLRYVITKKFKSPERVSKKEFRSLLKSKIKEIQDQHKRHQLLARLANDEHSVVEKMSLEFQKMSLNSETLETLV